MGRDVQRIWKKRIRVSNFQKLVEFIFCLPRTSAPVERIFSIMKSMWSESRSRMLEQNVKAVITCKINTDWSCSDFYKNVKLNNDFLKVLSTEKYDWANKQILFYYSFFRLLHRKNRNSIYFASLTSIPFYFSNWNRYLDREYAHELSMTIRSRKTARMAVNVGLCNNIGKCKVKNHS